MQCLSAQYGIQLSTVSRYLKRAGVPSRVSQRPLGYQGAHHRVRKIRGKPSVCEVCGTTSARKFEWANLTGNYADPLDYKRLCSSCHHRFDGLVRNLR